jgi:hypothetical protein
MAAKINRNVPQPGHPFLSRAAMVIEARAKGRAKIVWENFTNSPQLRIVLRIFFTRPVLAYLSIDG